MAFTLCTSKELGFSITTGTDCHKASASHFQRACPHCDKAPQYDNGRPITAVGENAALCPNCGRLYLYQEQHELDLSAEWVTLLERGVEWETARAGLDDICRKWGLRIGALIPHQTTPRVLAHFGGRESN